MTHPIVLPPHIEIKLIDEAPRFRDGGAARERWLIQRAAQLGADQELEACCEWVEREIGHGRQWGDHLRAARRPKPPSLKQQALIALDDVSSRLDAAHENIIRRALESLPAPQG